MKSKSLLSVFFIVTLALNFVSQTQAATITPNVFTDPAIGADPDNCSLRYAIQSINNGATFEGGCQTHSTGTLGIDDTVVLQEGTYVLTLAGNNESNNETGDLDVINKNIAIIGAGSDKTTIDASGIPDKDRVIEFIENDTLSITGVTLTGGDVSALGQNGGAILTLTVHVNLQDVQIIANKANLGGGIYTSCESTITDSAIQGNQALANDDGIGGGIFLAEENCDNISQINNTLISGNDADAIGGGIFVAENTSLIINYSTVDGNNAINGGGLYNNIGSLVGVSNSTISRNQATTDIPGSGVGGGVCDFSYYLFFTNSTVSQNTATSYGGGIYSGGGLKGAYNTTIAFNEVTDPNDGIGGGIAKSGNGDDDRFTAEIFNTIIAKNTASIAPDCLGGFFSGGNNLIGIIDSNDEGSTLCSNFANGVLDDQVGTPDAPIDPILGPLQLNGGATETHALLDGSPAIDRGNNTTGCQTIDQAAFINSAGMDLNFVGLTDDQRAFTRPIAILDPNVPICDIGAFELQAFDFEVTKDDGLNGASPSIGEIFTYTITMTNNGPGDAFVTLSDPLPSQVTFSSVTSTQGTCSEASGVVSCELGDILSGATATVSITVTATTQGEAVNTATVTASGENFTASVTTIIGRGVLEGSGCALTREYSANSTSALALFSLLTALAYGILRKRTID